MSGTTRRNVLQLASVAGFSLAGLNSAAAHEGDHESDSNQKPKLTEQNPVHGVRLENSVAHVYGANYGVVNPNDTQFVFVNVYSGLPLPRLKLDIDGTRYDHGIVGGVGVTSTVITDAHEVETLAGFEIPADINANSVKLVIENDAGDDVVAEFSTKLADELAKSAEFEVESFSIPSQSKASERMAMTVHVTNTGDREGTFFGTLQQENLSGATKYFAETIKPNQTQTFTTYRNYGPVPKTGDSQEVTFELDWGRGEHQASVIASR